MLEVHDYSNRRGVLVAMLPAIYDIFTENAREDKLSKSAHPENIIFWKQKMNRHLVDVSRRYLVVNDGALLAGLLFYRLQPEVEKIRIYIEDMQVARPWRKNPSVVDLLISRLENAPMVKDAVFFASNRIRIEANKDLLEPVSIDPSHYKSPGLLKENQDGQWEMLGDLKSATSALKTRYTYV